MGFATATFSSDDKPLETTAATAHPVVTVADHLWSVWFTVADASIALGRLLLRRSLRRDRARVGFMERRVGTASLLTLLLLVVLGAVVGIAVSSLLVHAATATGLRLAPSAQEAGSLGGRLARLTP